jgi:uncharacterized protein YndB with AHSA1/START domain
MSGTSRISREAYVRFCEGLGVRFPGATRRLRATAYLCRLGGRRARRVALIPLDHERRMTTITMNPSEESASFEIVSTRVFAAPRELVFEAFSNPDHLVHWWGPKGFTNTFSEFDLRPGGAWRFVMHGPDGVDYQNVKDFVEVVKPGRIVFQHLRPMHRFQMTMTFAEHSGKTELTWRMLFESAAETTKLKSFITEANEQNFDRLEAYMAKVS